MRNVMTVLARDLPILYQRDGMVAVAKPAGLPSTGHHIDDADCVQWVVGQMLMRPVWAVHQLDKGTSGVNLFVLRPNLVEEWQSRLKGGGKTYTCVCHGAPDWRSRVVDGPIGWAGTQRRRWVVEGGKPARTRLAVVARATHYSLVRAHPETGRTHQVRIHLGYVGHPLVGEDRYRRRPCSRFGRPALHLGEVRLPGAGRLVAPLPDDMRHLMDELHLDRAAEAVDEADPGYTPPPE